MTDRSKPIFVIKRRGQIWNYAFYGNKGTADGELEKYLRWHKEEKRKDFEIVEYMEKPAWSGNVVWKTREEIARDYGED